MEQDDRDEAPRVLSPIGEAAIHSAEAIAAAAVYDFEAARLHARASAAWLGAALADEALRRVPR